MKKLKEILYLTFLSALIMTGLALIMSPWIKNTIVQESAATFTITTFTAEELSANNMQTAGVSFDEQIEVLDFQTVLTGFNQVNRQDVIGAIAIYDVDMLVPIFNGTTSENLIVGATTMIEGQVMGLGNYALAGHHMQDAALLFGPLLDVVPGMQVQITDKNNVYTYEVTETFMVTDTDWWILDETDVPTLTLMTCDVPGATPYRWIVRAELVSQVAYGEEESPEVQVFQRTVETSIQNQQPMMRYALIAPIALVPVFVFGNHAVKGRKSRSSL